MSKYMKRLLYLSACLLLAATACQRQQPEPAPAASIRILPVITKATATDFENGDAIGVTITRESGAYATNAQFTYDGTAFSGSLKWYNESTDPSTIKAYYPYSANGSATFTVATDQSAGTSSSDFIAAVRENVLPSPEAVVLPFQHKLTSITVKAVNNSGTTLGDFVLQGLVPVAVVADDYSAQADATAEPAAIKTCPRSEGKYEAIVPPQTAVITATVTVGGKELSQKLQEATLLAGKRYTINVIVNPADMKVVLSGDIEDWENGGDLNPDNTEEPAAFEEHLDEGYISYEGVRYNVVKLKDGKWWMAQNLAFVPQGFTPASDLTAVTAGVFFPLKVNDGHTAAEFDTSEEGVAAKGYLYQAEVALGLKVGDLTTVAAAEALAGAQGICPAGWHIPSYDDMNGLIGKMNSVTNSSAPYQINANGSITALNEDGFNMDAFGAVTIQDNTKTNGTFMGWATAYPDKLSSGMFCGSSYAGVTYNTAGDETSGIKNLQFWGLMAMTNKSSEDQYTCNGTKVSYRIAGPVRCVRNAE